IPQIASRARHASAADPRKTGLRDLCADSADQLCAKRVTRGLAGDDADRDRRLGWNNPCARSLSDQSSLCAAPKGGAIRGLGLPCAAQWTPTLAVGAIKTAAAL